MNCPKLFDNTKKYDFLSQQSIPLNIAKIAQETQPEPLLKNMQSLFHDLKKFVDPELSELINCKEDAHYVKHIYLEQELPNGVLCFESLVFFENSPTGPHTHPFYLVDEVISGEMHETLFEKNQDIYSVKENVQRKAPHKRSVHAPCGYPHDVQAVNGPCVSLSLSFGKEKVAPIDVSQISSQTLASL